MKKCKICKEVKPIEEFPLHGIYTKGNCKPCEAEYQKSLNKKERYKDYQRSYIKKKREFNPSQKLIDSLRSRHNQVLKGEYSTTKGLGCDKDSLRQHIEKQFTEGMTWDNYGHGRGYWNLDHITPLDLIKTNPELTPQIIHYTNLQPMWMEENIKKGKKIVGSLI
jgi:hypothetical protein